MYGQSRGVVESDIQEALNIEHSSSLELGMYSVALYGAERQEG